MNLIERNHKLYDLRNKLAWAKTEVMAIEAEIRQVRHEYENQDLDLYSKLFQTVTKMVNDPKMS